MNTAEDNSDSQSEISPTGRLERRRQPEGASAAFATHGQNLTSEEIERLFHELHVYQIELETQNEDLRKAQELLQRSQSQYFELYNLAPVGYVTLSGKGLILEVNLTIAALLGTHKEAMINRLFIHFIVSEDQDIYYGYRRQLKKGAERQTCELRMRRDDGEKIWVKLETSAILDETNEAILLRTIVIDINRRKLAEEQLRANQVRLQAIVDTVVTGIITIDQRGIVHSFNKAAEQMFGYSAEDMIGQNINIVMSSPEREQHNTYLETMIKSGRPNVVGKQRELQATRKDGSRFFLSLGIGEFNEGKERFFCGILQDITERKLAETSLIESEERLSLAMDASGEGLWDWDIRNDSVVHNQKWFELLGLDPLSPELTTQFFTRLLHDDDKCAVMDRLHESLETSGRFHSEHRLRRADGAYIWVSENGIVVKRDEQGQPLRMVGSFTDISGRKKIEAERRSIEIRYRTLVDQAAPEAMFVHDQMGDFIEVNQKACEYLGYSKAELLNMSVFDLDQDFKIEIAQDMWLTLDQSETKILLGHHRRKNGTVFPVEINLGVFEDNGQRLYIAFVRDISIRKQRERELREHQNHYERLLKLEVTNQTVAAIAHELNQPLSATSSYIDAAQRFLKAGNLQPKKLAYALVQSAEQIRRTGKVVHELFKFLRAGEIITTALDINQMVRTVIATLKEDGVLGHFIAILELAEGLPKVRANSLQLEKVLTNLVRNGVEAMQSNGLSSGAIMVIVKTAENGNYALVTVRDSGRGLDIETARRIFEPFYTTKSNGLGMGLALSRALIEAMGGQLWYESDSNPGAVFHLTIPFASEA